MSKEKKNKLINIGFTGCYSCYLNITKKEAINRYAQKENLTAKEVESSDFILIEEIEFNDEFGAYEIWD